MSVRPSQQEMILPDRVLSARSRAVCPPVGVPFALVCLFSLFYQVSLVGWGKQKVILINTHSFQERLTKVGIQKLASLY
jgi:hypothetical protein